MTFETYIQQPGNESALKAAKKFAASKSSLYIFGDPGNGKTHLLAAAYQAALSEYCPLYVPYFNIAKLLKIERDDFETREEAEARKRKAEIERTIGLLDNTRPNYVN
jgi:chromosomal replication initiation ATPase DnaA